MVQRISGLLLAALLTALPQLAWGQSAPLPALPVQVPSAPPDSPLPPVVIGTPQSPPSPIGPPPGPPGPPPGPFGPPPGPPPSAFGIGVNPPPPSAGIGASPPPPVIPPGPLFIQGQPPACPGLFDGTPFIGLQLDFLKSVATDNLQITFPRNDGTAITVHPPSHSLDWTISPELEFGWHLCQNNGDVEIGYRFLATDGSGTLSDAAGAFDVKSRLNINLVDMNYASFPDEFAPHWFVRWRLGARVADAYYDTTSTGAMFTDQASNNFVGAGPLGGIEVWRQLAVLPAFSLFARADGTVMVGLLTQKYYETFEDDPASPLSGTIKTRVTQSVPTLNLSLGVNYTPPAANYLHFSLGVEWERWWSLGRSYDARLDLNTSSVFLRGQYDF
jgi:Legionella pneumophila major outer membrane protein precursor